MSSSSGCASQGSVGVSSAGDTRELPASGWTYHCSATSMTPGQPRTSAPAGGATRMAVRRFGTMPTRADARQRCQPVGPGAGGVDEDGGGDLAVARAEQPLVTPALKAQQLRAGAERAAEGAQAAEEGLKDGSHVHVGRRRVEEGRGDVVAAQRRDERAGLVGAEQAGILAWGPGFRFGADEVELVLPGDAEDAARGDERRVGEAGRRVVVEGGAGEVEAADDGVAVERGQQGCGAAGGMVARLGLALEQQHAAALGQGGRRRGARDPGAHHHDIEPLGHAPTSASGRLPQRLVQGRDQPVDLVQRVVVDHRDADDAVLLGEAEVLDQAAGVEVAEADADAVAVDGSHDGAGAPALRRRS